MGCDAHRRHARRCRSQPARRLGHETRALRLIVLLLLLLLVWLPILLLLLPVLVRRRPRGWMLTGGRRSRILSLRGVRLLLWHAVLGTGLGLGRGLALLVIPTVLLLVVPARHGSQFVCVVTGFASARPAPQEEGIQVQLPDGSPTCQNSFASN